MKKGIKKGESVKSILLIYILLTLQIDANISQERNIATQKFKKQVVHCPDGSKSFILSKDDIYYSASYKKFLFIRKAGRDSCRKKHIRTKKGATVCTRKKDIYRMLKDKISKPAYIHNYATCLKLNTSVPLKILNHFPFTSKITYYKAEYKNKVFYVSSQDIYKSRKYGSTKSKKHHKQKISKRHNNIQKKKKRIKLKNRKKHILKHNNNFSIHKKQKHRPREKRSYIEPSIVAPIQNLIVTPQAEVVPVETNTHTYEKTPVGEVLPKESNIHSNKSSLTKEPIPIYDYTYRCIAVYGDNRITVDNSVSMISASDSIWRRCQALKTNDEVCKIQDCYKLIK